MAYYEDFETVEETWPVERLLALRAGDYPDTNMAGALEAMADFWDRHPVMAHSGEQRHGGPKAYVDHLAESMRTHGYDAEHPVKVRVDYSGLAFVQDGHHRTLAAHRAGLPEIPVQIRRPKGDLPQ